MVGVDVERSSFLNDVAGSVKTLTTGRCVVDASCGGDSCNNSQEVEKHKFQEGCLRRKYLPPCRTRLQNQPQSLPQKHCSHQTKQPRISFSCEKQKMECDLTVG